MWRIRMVLRRVMRAALLRMAARLEDAAPSGGGPPKHWLEKVRKASPQFVESGGAAPPAAVTKRAPSAFEVAQQRARAAIEGNDETKRTNRTHRINEEALAPVTPIRSHRSYESHESHPSYPSHRSPFPPLEEPPPLPRKRHHADLDEPLDRWPELPELSPAAIEAILTLDDVDHLRLLEEEQRGHSWTE
ncbi:MAG TPA: hypothetical protein VF618_06020 [Thermoanaerobaculia bacterium]